MSEEIRFSIITVCYNSAKTIEKTIQSVLAQTYSNYEYLIVDGGSTDGTLDVIQKYEPQFDGKLKWTSEPDGGIYDAMNKGIRRASGQLIGIVNSDDFYEPNALADMAKAYDGSLYMILYGLERQLQDGREVRVISKNHEFLESDMITHPTCFVTKALYETFGTYSLEYKYSSDYEFMLRMFHNTQVKFKEVYSLISNYDLGGASSRASAYLETITLLYIYWGIS